MPHGLHTFLRILIPGGIILLESFLLYAFTFRSFPGDSDVWTFLSQEWGQTTGFAIASMILGWAYYSFEVTHIVDGKTFNGMASVRANITNRLTSPFRSDPELRDKLDRLEWRTVKRVFFQFIDETPSLKTSNELAFLSGLAFYSFIDVACISSFFLFIAICGWLFAEGAPLAVKIYAATLAVIILLAIGGAKTSIKKHTETSNLQLDAILSDHIEQLRERLVRSPTVE